jgi:hypothetical protein
MNLSKLKSFWPVSITIYINIKYSIQRTEFIPSSAKLSPPGALASGYWNCALVDPDTGLRSQRGSVLNGVKIGTYSVLDLRAEGRILLKAWFWNLRLKLLHIVLKMKSDCFIHTISFYDG